MKTTFFIYSKWLLCVALLLWEGIALAQAPAISWQKNLGGSSDDSAYSIEQTTDGGYIVAGTTYSKDGDITGKHGICDYWIVKLDANGNLSWQKNLGGSLHNNAYAVKQTTDGGYIVAGSREFEIIGGEDYWIVKLNANGHLSWQKSFGGNGTDIAYAIEQTTDGGYIVAGKSDSERGDVKGNHADYDYWIVKLNANGHLSWQKSLGGFNRDIPNSIQQTTDGGYIVVGVSYSNDGDVTGNHGDFDYWIVKLDADGNLSWQKCLGGSSGESNPSIQQTTDGGYIVAGKTYSDDGDITINLGGEDYWIVKLDANGTMVWQKSLGGSGWETANSIQQSADGGYIVAGYIYSIDGDVTGNHGGGDYWVVKLDANGNLSWQKCLGGREGDWAFAIRHTADGGYIVAGESNSDDGDVTGNYGDRDYWIVKLGGIAFIDPNIIVSPNPVLGDSIKIGYCLSSATAVEISIIDVLGNRVLCEKAVLESAGEHKRVIAVGGLASGTYFVQLKTEYGSRSTQIIKI